MSVGRRGASLSFLLTSLHQELLIVDAMLRSGRAQNWTQEIRNVMAVPALTRLSSLGLAISVNLSPGPAKEAVLDFTRATGKLIEHDDEATHQATLVAFDRLEAFFPTVSFL